MEDNKSKCLAMLDAAGVKYRLAEHAHADTIDDVIALGLEGGDRIAKNLFVRDDKKLNYYVLTVGQSKHVSLKDAQESMGSRRLSFASEEELAALMGLKKGSVTPFGLLADSAHRTVAVFDSFFSEGMIGIHPMENTSTVFLRFSDLKALLEEQGTEIVMI